jgi:hypothetical protein
MRHDDAPSDTNNEIHFWLSRHVEVTSCTCSTLQTDLLLLLRKVTLDVGFCTLEYNLTLGLACL